MNRLRLLAGVMALAIAGAAGASTAHADKWDMPLAYAATNFHSENAAEFGKCVAGASGGAIDIVTHPSGSLFKGNEIWRAVQTGQAPIGERLISAHANENPLFGIDSVPFLASSFEESEKLWSVARDAVAQALDEKNLVLLYAVPWPPQGLYFKKSVASVADMKGVRFRSYNTATARLAELTGMLPVQVEAAELSQALATGVAESFISSGATGYDRKVWEHLTHFYEVDSWLPRNVVFVNKDVWNGLDDAKRKALTDCATTAASEGLKRSIAYTQFTLKGLREGGMTVGPASETLVKELKAIGVTMTEEWLKEAGDGGRAIVEAFRKM